MPIEDQAQKVVEKVRRAGDSDKMSQQEWKEFLEIIISELEGDYHAVCEELEA